METDTSKYALITIFLIIIEEKEVYLVVSYSDMLRPLNLTMTCVKEPQTPKSVTNSSNKLCIRLSQTNTSSKL